MSRLRHRVETIRSHNHRIADAAVVAVDRLREVPTPAFLDEVQGMIVQDLITTEKRLGELALRQGRRRDRFRRLRNRRPEAGPQIGAHNALLVEQTRLLRERRQTLREVGDACAWIVLRESPRLLLPLFAKRSHGLPTGAGLAGPLEVMRRLNSSGEFFALDADLTNCIGRGDLILVGADGRWQHPLALELKSKQELTTTGMGEIDFIVALTDLPPDLALYDAVVKFLGLKPREGSRRAPRVERQEHELADAAKLLVRVSSIQIDYALRSAKKTWRSIQNVLERALQIGPTFDISEPGIAFAAVRRASPLSESKRLLERLQESGFHQDYGYLTTSVLHSGGQTTAVLPPIALWPLPRPFRTALLAREVELVCVFTPLIWEEAARAEGLELRRDNGTWLIGDKRGWARFDPIESRVLQAGVALAGISPRAVCQRISVILDAEVKDH